MRKLSVLKALIDLAFFFSAIVIIAIIIIIPIIIFDYVDDPIPIKINGQEIIVRDWPTRLILISAGISSLFFFYSLYLLRKTITFFKQRDLFNEKVVRYFSIIGKCVIISSLLASLPVFLYNMIERGNFGISFNTAGFDAPILAIILGLFFMVLSEAFRIAKNLKEENDLTL